MSTLEDFKPQTDDEQMAAALAVRQARKQADAAAIADTLTPRERFLIEAAYAHGMRKACNTIGKAIGPAATTLDANQMRAAINSPGQYVSASRQAPMDYDVELLAIVREAQRDLQHHQG